MKTTGSHNVKWPSLKNVGNAMNRNVLTGENYVSFQIVCRSVVEDLFFTGTRDCIMSHKNRIIFKISHI